jgi:hypothetical protein
MIRTLRPDGKNGIYMNEEVYNRIHSFFITTLEQETELTLTALIALAKHQLPAQLMHDIGFNLIHIKLDLLARNVITQTSTRSRRIHLPVISLKHTKRLRLQHIKPDNIIRGPNPVAAT